MTTSPTSLKSYLNPNGAAADATQVPDVLGSDGQPILFNSGNRITSEATVVDLGNGPNTNTGDPLRLAFLKLNNFVEASYILNQFVDSDIQSLVAGIDGGRF